MEDLGNAEHILGMKINIDTKDILLFLSQKRYIEKVLNRFNMAEARFLGVSSPSYVNLAKLPER